MSALFVENRKDHLLGMLWGLIVGEAVGLPVKGQPREFRKVYPIETITGWGSFNLPPGYWNDKGGFLLSVLSGLTDGYPNIMDALKAWYYEGEFTPEGKIYDLTQSLKNIIEEHASGLEFDRSIINEEIDNGADKIGLSLIPFIYCLVHEKLQLNIPEIENLFKRFHQTPVFTLAIYTIAFVNFYLINQKSKDHLTENLLSFLSKMEGLKPYKKIVKQLIPRIEMIPNRDPEEFNPDESILSVLEVSLKSVLEGKNYEETVLLPVNLGGPTDATAALTGMWAGALYGFSNIPMSWLEYIPKKDKIQNLTVKFIDLLKEENLALEKVQQSM